MRTSPRLLNSTRHTPIASNRIPPRALVTNNAVVPSSSRRMPPPSTTPPSGSADDGRHPAPATHLEAHHTASSADPPSSSSSSPSSSPPVQRRRTNTNSPDSRKGRNSLLLDQQLARDALQRNLEQAIEHDALPRPAQVHLAPNSSQLGNRDNGSPRAVQAPDAHRRSSSTWDVTGVKATPSSASATVFSALVQPWARADHGVDAAGPRQGDSTLTGSHSPSSTPSSPFTGAPRLARPQLALSRTSDKCATLRQGASHSYSTSAISEAEQTRHPSSSRGTESDLAPASGGATQPPPLRRHPSFWDYEAMAMGLVPLPPPMADGTASSTTTMAMPLPNDGLGADTGAETGSNSFFDAMSRLRASVMGVEEGEGEASVATWLQKQRAALERMVQRASVLASSATAASPASAPPPDAASVRGGAGGVVESLEAIQRNDASASLEKLRRLGATAPSSATASAAAFKRSATAAGADTVLLRPRSTFESPRLPLVFCHGLFGFDRMSIAGTGLSVDYWRGIVETLERRGNEVLIAKVPMAGSIEERAEALRSMVEERFSGREVNLIGHSMGGLDCRHLITHMRHERDFTVRSLTTIATPHRGSSFADYVLDDVIGAQRLPKLLALLDGVGLPGGGRAFEQLTTRKMGEFNERTPDDPDVKYFSWGAAFRPGLFNEFRIPWGIIYEKEGPNDGLVSVKSSRWGTRYQGTLPASHTHLIGWARASVRADHDDEGAGEIDGAQGSNGGADPREDGEVGEQVDVAETGDEVPNGRRRAAKFTRAGASARREASAATEDTVGSNAITAAGTTATTSAPAPPLDPVTLYLQIGEDLAREGL